MQVMLVHALRVQGRPSQPGAPSAKENCGMRSGFLNGPRPSNPGHQVGSLLVPACAGHFDDMHPVGCASAGCPAREQLFYKPVAVRWPLVPCTWPQAQMEKGRVGLPRAGFCCTGCCRTAGPACGAAAINPHSVSSGSIQGSHSCPPAAGECFHRRKLCIPYQAAPFPRHGIPPR